MCRLRPGELLFTINISLMQESVKFSTAVILLLQMVRKVDQLSFFKVA